MVRQLLIYFKHNKIVQALILLGMVLSISACKSVEEVAAELADGEDEAINVIESLGTNATVISRTSFEAKLLYSGDKNKNAIITLYYCNDTDNPGCDPMAAYSTYLVRRPDGSFINLISGLPAGFDTNDTVKLGYYIVDPDGIRRGNYFEASIVLQEQFVTVSIPVVNNFAVDGFDVSLDFSGDDDSDSTAMFYYCNETDSPACDPLSGASQVLTKGASSFTYNVSGLSSPYDSGDYIKYQFVASDTGGVNGGPFSGSFSVPYDVTPPVFAGASGIVKISGVSAKVTWSAATDNADSSSALIYEVCQATTSGDCASSFTADYTTSAGETEYTVSGLTDGIDYFFVVRAVDTTGNRDTNTTQVARTNLTYTQIMAGVNSSCALHSDGRIFCWGSNSYGALGNGSTTQSLIPVQVSNISNATKIALGGNGINCALLSTGQVKCWGRGTWGGMGDGSNSDNLVPNYVTGITNATDIAVGSGHGCVILSTGSLKCWGSGGSGQLGYGAFGDRNTPVSVIGIDNATSVAAGRQSCVSLTTGQVKCWGYNMEGQAQPGAANWIHSPVVVPGVSSAVQLSAGRYGTSALLSDGRIISWGSADRGDGTWAGQSHSPTYASGINNAVLVSAGNRHACATLSTGQIKCWGRGNEGQMGNGTTNRGLYPITVSGINNAILSSGSMGHLNCAILSSDELKCWGHNSNGQLGNRNTTNQLSPVDVLF